MDLRIFTEPQQGASYDQLARLAIAAEELGYDAFFRSDHYLRMGDGDPSPGPTDAWTTLAGLARDTSRIRLGTLVSSATFRHPGVLAVQVAQVDAMSGGRVELGLGTGWFEAEHRAFGIPFPDKRFGLLEEQLEILTGLWQTPAGGSYSFSGQHYQLTDNPGLPKPVQTPLPIVVGGNGPRRTPRLAARYGAEYNQSFPGFEAIGPQIERVRGAMSEAGRDPEELVYSVALIAVVGRDEAEFERRAAVVGREPAELREHGLAGTPSEVVDRIGQLKADGISRIYLQCMDVDDLDMIELIAAEVAPQV
ncbi:LLM class F420-dependent oxidoreductase [Bogoriella caseilytica]|nr:LLM class F420-dependent oxidoreductase [Bogoriella caseilytica]